jgi:hypothetical protein
MHRKFAQMRTSYIQLICSHTLSRIIMTLRGVERRGSTRSSVKSSQLMTTGQEGQGSTLADSIHWQAAAS